MSKKTIYINVRKNTKYGLIQSLDVSVDGTNILTAHTHDVIMLGKEFIDVKSMLIAGAIYTDLQNVDEIDVILGTSLPGGIGAKVIYMNRDVDDALVADAGLAHDTNHVRVILSKKF